jgi:hypothetical protein
MWMGWIVILEQYIFHFCLDYFENFEECVFQFGPKQSA